MQGAKGTGSGRFAVANLIEPYLALSVRRSLEKVR